MASSTFSYELVIRESHLDLLGHMNNAVYFQIFEEARWEFITQGGYGLEKVRSSKQGPVLLEAQIKFLREIRLREKIVVRSTCHAPEGKVSKVVQTMEKEDGTIACEASFAVGFFDLEKRKLIAPTPEWLRAVGLEKA